jgi:hypothetical protein
MLYLYDAYLWPNIRFLLSTVTEKNATKNILDIGITYCGKRFWTREIPTSCLPTLLIFIHWTYMLIFRRIFLSKYWWQKSDISSQVSYRYPILWEAFFDPSDAFFLTVLILKETTLSWINCTFCKFNKMNCGLMLTYDTLAYMFNVYKNQPSRQARSRNLMGPKTLTTIWGTYMKLLTKYQIPVISLSHFALKSREREVKSPCFYYVWWALQALYRYAILWEAFLGSASKK